MVVVTTCFFAAALARTVPENRQIVGFGSAAQKDQILGIAGEQTSHLAAGYFELLLGHLAVLVDTGRVSIHFK